jgi:hypothetical protein
METFFVLQMEEQTGFYKPAEQQEASMAFILQVPILVL